MHLPLAPFGHPKNTEAKPRPKLMLPLRQARTQKPWTTTRVHSLTFGRLIPLGPAPDPNDATPSSWRFVRASFSLASPWIVTMTPRLILVSALSFKPTTSFRCTIPDSPQYKTKRKRSHTSSTAVPCTWSSVAAPKDLVLSTPPVFCRLLSFFLYTHCLRCQALTLPVSYYVLVGGPLLASFLSFFSISCVHTCTDISFLFLPFNPLSVYG